MRKMILMAAAILLQQPVRARCVGGGAGTHISMVRGSFGIVFRFGNH
jgi:hypothetical protein